jgi:hypothetical protein
MARSREAHLRLTARANWPRATTALRHKGSCACVLFSRRGCRWITATANRRPGSVVELVRTTVLTRAADGTVVTA